VNLTIHRNDLLAAVTSARAVAQTRATIPVLTCLKLHANGDGRVSLEGCDLTRHVVDTAAATITTPGDVAMPADILAAIAKALPETDLTIDIDPQTLRATIKAGRARYVVSCLPGDDFPSLRTTDDAPSARLSLPAAVAHRLMIDGMFAASTDDTKYYMNGVHVRCDGTALIFETCDGHRVFLQRYTPQMPVTGIPAAGFIVPRDTAKALSPLCTGDGSIEINVFENAIEVRRGDQIVISKLIDGTYPAIDRLIEGAALGRPARMTCKRADLRQAIARIHGVADAKIPSIRMLATGDRLTIYAQSDGGTHTAEDGIDADVAAKVDTAVNARYIIEQLDVMIGDRITLECGVGLDPIRIVDDGAPDDVHIVMPMRWTGAPTS
jgi:DNA polymerase-3 subunit beta